MNSKNKYNYGKTWRRFSEPGISSDNYSSAQFLLVAVRAAFVVPFLPTNGPSVTGLVN